MPIRQEIAANPDTTTGSLLVRDELTAPQSRERWDQVPSLITARAWHHMALLPNGRALVMGGSPDGGFTALASAETFEGDRWQQAAPMPSARVFPVVFHLPKGKVLVCGGTNPFGLTFANSLATSLLYDPATNTWTATGPIPATHNYRPVDGGARFPQCIIRGGAHDGDPFIAGGTGFEDPDTTFFRWGGTKSTIRFDTATQAWVATAQMSRRRGYVAALVPLGGGKVLMVGGISYDVNSLAPLDPDQQTDTCEIYDADADTWTACDPLPVIAGETAGAYPIVAPGGKPAGYQARRILGRGIPLGDGKALVIGGLGPVDLNLPVAGPPFVPSRPRATCWVFDLARAPTTQWRQTASMQAGRCYPAVFVQLDGQIVVAGGIDELWSPGSYSTEVFNPRTETWRSGPDLPLTQPQPAGSQRPNPIFAGLSWGTGETLTTGKLLVAGAHQNQRIDQTLFAVFTGGGETPVPFAAQFTPGAPSAGTPPGTPLATPAVDASLAGFLNFPLVG
jgi:hypothetical protein